MTRTDHAAIAEARVDDAAAIAPELSTSKLDTAHLIYTEAAVHAMLALVPVTISYAEGVDVSPVPAFTITEKLQEDEFAPGECRGDGACDVPVHVHGCFADVGNCDDPDDHTEKGAGS